MITEDYVSFTTAKLLKEKGFDAECDYLYIEGGLVRAQGGACNWNDGETLFANYKNECSAPTLQRVMKWLREVHYYNIEIDTLGMMELNTLSWRSAVYYLVNENECYCEDGFDSYEEAAEAAIKYCLENLI